MEIKGTFKIDPTTNLIDVLGHSGYTFNFAIADIIDNCIAAFAKNIEIHFDTTSKNQSIYILDDGVGMDEKRLKEAAVPGFKKISEQRESTDLGRFSTGLKSATSSFCNKVIITSKTKNSKHNTISIDYDHIRKSNTWEAYIIKRFELEKKVEQHGTLVYCTNLIEFDDNKFNVYDKIEGLSKALSHIYGKYLLSQKINIIVTVDDSNPIEIVGWNPFGLIENKTTKIIYEKDLMYKENVIKIKSYILPVFNNLNLTDQNYMIGRGLVEQEGFYIYRNGRLINEGGWLNLGGLGMDDKSKYARIDVEIPIELDEDFNINFSKNHIEIPKDLEKIFIDIAKKSRTESNRNFNYVKHKTLVKKTLKNQEDKIWKTSNSSAGMILVINDNHPVINDLCKGMSINDKKRLLSIISKSIPISLIQSQTTGVESYTYNEIKQLTATFYMNLKKEGKSTKEIKMILRDTEPFKENIEAVIAFFEEQEEDHDK